MSKLLGAASSWRAFHQGNAGHIRKPAQTMLFGQNLFTEDDENLTLVQEKAPS